MRFIAKRSFQTSARSFQRMFGWGRSDALPLKDCKVEAFKKPVCLSERPEYALHKQDKVTHVATGWAHSLVCVNSRKIYGFGLIGNKKQQPLLFDSGDDSRIELMACGREHSHFVVRDAAGEAQLYSLGNGMYGQLGNGKSKTTDPGTLVYAHEPTKIEGYQGNITHIATGLDHTVFATDAHQLYAMGWGADGQLGLGDGSTSDSNVPALLPWHGSAIKKLAGSTDFTLALTENGEIWTWGNSEYGQGMTGAKVDRILKPVRLDINNVVDMAAGGPFSVVLTADGCVHTCGYGVLGLGADVLETLTLRKVPDLVDVKQVFATTDYAAALTANGQVYVWGLNGTSGRLGLGHTDHAFTPSRLDIECPIHHLALGTHHALAISE